MASDAISGIGTVFQRWDGVDTWVPIAEVSAISGPSKTRNTIDVTSLDSIEGYADFIGGLRDGGTVNLTMNFTRATYDIMNADFESDTLQNYEIVLPDDDETSLEFEGLVTELPLEIPVDDRITANVVIKVSGKVTVNSGSGS